MSPGNKKMKSSNSIQENNNLRKKMVEQIYQKVLSTVVDELLHPFWRFSLHTRVFTKSSIGLNSRPKAVASKKTMLLVKYIYQ
jgi:hypothetical protein